MTGPVPPAEHKRCPYCAEEIRAAAVVCKHCGRKVVPANRVRLLVAGLSAFLALTAGVVAIVSLSSSSPQTQKTRAAPSGATSKPVAAPARGEVDRGADPVTESEQKRRAASVAEPVTQLQRSVQQLAPVYTPPVPAGPSMSDRYAQRERCYKALLPIWRESNTTLEWSGGADLAFRSPLAGSIPKVLFDSGTMTKLADICYFESVTLTDNRGYFAHYDLPLSATAIAEIRGY